MEEISRNAALIKHSKISQEGMNNPNWKSGRSKDNYYYKKIQKERYPEKVRAREMVHNALKSGKLIKPDECDNCRRDIFLQGHHEDYNQPLNVVWLCKTCHADVHR